MHAHAHAECNLHFKIQYSPPGKILGTAHGGSREMLFYIILLLLSRTIRMLAVKKAFRVLTPLIYVSVQYSIEIYIINTLNHITIFLKKIRMYK